MLFGLLMWDVLFQDGIPDVFRWEAEGGRWEVGLELGDGRWEVGHKGMASPTRICGLCCSLSSLQPALY